jgi:hypothetical protein
MIPWNGDHLHCGWGTATRTAGDRTRAAGELFPIEHHVPALQVPPLVLAEIVGGEDVVAVHAGEEQLSTERAVIVAGRDELGCVHVTHLPSPLWQSTQALTNGKSCIRQAGTTPAYVSLKNVLRPGCRAL